MAPDRTNPKVKKAVSEALVRMPQYLIDLQDASFALKSRNEIGYTLPDKLYEDAALMTRSYDISNLVHDQLSYAVLSHRWGPGEPDFKTISEMGGVTAATNDQRYAELPGYKKLLSFCLKVQSLGFNYAWTDTCCIDKRSSAELQEALNSMYQWYNHSSLCIAYLGQAETLEELGQDEWFTRGWTLQELLAPMFLIFYKKDWVPLDPDNIGMGRGTSDKLSHKVAPIIQAATGISSEFLRGFYPGDRTVKLIMEVMSWAADRTTERPEDIAYCLLGIFNITMPILYGEGESAFFRLQKELIKRTPDWTIFFWGGQPSRQSTMLPSHPRCFSQSQWGPPAIRMRELLLTPTSSGHPRYHPEQADAAPHTLTQLGLHIERDLYAVEKASRQEGPGESQWTYIIKAPGLSEITFRSTTDFSELENCRGHVYLVAISAPIQKSSLIVFALVYNLHTEDATRFKMLPTQEPIVAEKLSWPKAVDGVRRFIYIH